MYYFLLCVAEYLGKNVSDLFEINTELEKINKTVWPEFKIDKH